MAMVHIFSAGFALLSSWFLWRYAKDKPDAKYLRYGALSLIGVALCEIAFGVVSL